MKRFFILSIAVLVVIAGVCLLKPVEQRWSFPFDMQEAYAQPGGSMYLISTDVAADATYTTDLNLAGCIIHASAANASVIIYDGTGTGTVLWRWKEATDEESSGEFFGGYTIRAGTSIRLDLTGCTATLLRRYD